MHFYLVRHGESQYNAEGRIQGQLDVELSSAGRRQSLALAAALADKRIEAIFTSPLKRAAETAQPIAEALGLALQSDDRLREIHAGIFQGLLWREIESAHPVAAAQWLKQEPDFVVPGGESRRALMTRGTCALTYIRTLPYSAVAVVSHGGLLSAALKGLLAIPVERAPFSLRNASITQARWDDQFRLLTLNDTEHLRSQSGATENGGDLAL